MQRTTWYSAAETRTPMDRAVTEKEATASCSNAFESRYLRRTPTVRTALPGRAKHQFAEVSP